METPDGLHGQSLIPVLQDHSANVKPGALSFNKGYSLRTDDWHYMRYNDNTMELYDMRSDPKEFTNLATSPAHRADRDRTDAGFCRSAVLGKLAGPALWAAPARLSSADRDGGVRISVDHRPGRVLRVVAFLALGLTLAALAWLDNVIGRQREGDSCT